MNATTEIEPKLVKQLREKTNAGFMDCKRALVESGGDLEKAETILRTKGIASAAQKATRATKEGVVASYIHLQGKVGVLVVSAYLVNCKRRIQLEQSLRSNRAFQMHVKLSLRKFRIEVAHRQLP